jgi:uncharacterized protein (TIGR03083 family)
MTTMTPSTSRPVRRSNLDRATAKRLAATEYTRFVDTAAAIPADRWHDPTDCVGWDVHAVVAHILGMVEMAASRREGIRQNRAAGIAVGRAGGLFIDALTDLQVREHTHLTPEQLVALLRRRAPKAARARSRTPGFILRRARPGAAVVNGKPDPWAFGYLIDTILTRDPWMHRVDLCRATGTPLHLTADHDAVLVADAVAEWADRHGRPYLLHLTGPAGGTWSFGTGADRLELDAVEFCRLISGRGAKSPMDTHVPF